MEACSIGNLGDKAQNRRLRMGLIGLGFALLLAVFLVQLGVPAVARVGLFVPFFLGAYGAFQGLFRTCTYAASQNMRVTDAGEEKLLENRDRERLKRDGKMVMVGSVLTASMATVLCVVAL